MPSLSVKLVEVPDMKPSVGTWNQAVRIVLGVALIA